MRSICFDSFPRSSIAKIWRGLCSTAHPASFPSSVLGISITFLAENSIHDLILWWSVLNERSDFLFYRVSGSRW
jgi:hypothetical protein